LPSQNDNQAVLNLLEEFNGLASLKKLQAQLNWDREDAPISRQSWKGDSRQLLLNDPVVTASVGGASQQLFGEEQSFKVIYCRLASPELLLTHERAVVAELLGSYPYALFVFSDKTQKRFHFLNVKDEPEGQKRRLFRRITVGNGERLRTAATQLALLDGEILKRLSLSGIQAKFDEAFDVGPVTKRFFAEYKRVFELVKEGIKGFATGQAGDEARNLFTQRLFNRLMFLAFIQKKGWLQYDGNPDYLRTLWTAHESDKFANKGSFYEGRLKLLFFEGLGANSDAQNLIGINRGGTLKTIIGDVPYLNGGLFEKDADDDNLRGLMRVLLFKRFESSVFAFRETVGRLLKTHRMFLKSLEAGFVPAGEHAQTLLANAEELDNTAFLEALESVSKTYRIEDFHVDLLKEHIEHDISVLEGILEQVAPITPAKDAKLQRLLGLLPDEVLAKGKRLIFTQYTDTARYLYENLNPAGKHQDIDVIFSGDKSKFRIVGRFSPHSNPEYVWHASDTELNTVIATDVLSEGLNLQDCDTIINYDLHWNPVRLIQRFGRIDRIGSDHDTVFGMNFLPETEMDRHLGLKQVLENRIAEIHGSIGEDSAILDPAEQINEEAMYAIYEGKSEQLGLFDSDDLLSLNEAEEILRHLKAEDPAEYERIASLRDGIRSAKASVSAGTFVFCQAGDYQQLFLTDATNAVSTRDVPAVLGNLKCDSTFPASPLPTSHNARVMTIRALFAKEVEHRKTERQHSLSLSHGQKYVLRELRSFAALLSEDDEQRASLVILERAFRSSALTSAAKKELVNLRRNNVVGENLYRSLGKIYDQHNLRDQGLRGVAKPEIQVPRIICSEALI
jgi:hypothetical protein